jgi:hypothetical protein
MKNPIRLAAVAAPKKLSRIVLQGHSVQLRQKLSITINSSLLAFFANNPYDKAHYNIKVDGGYY